MHCVLFGPCSMNPVPFRGNCFLHNPTNKYTKRRDNADENSSSLTGAIRRWSLTRSGGWLDGGVENFSKEGFRN